MPTFDRRIAISDSAAEVNRPQAVVSSVTDVQNAEGDVTEVGVFVQPGAAGLFVSVGPDGEQPASAPVKDVHSVELRPLNTGENRAVAPEGDNQPRQDQPIIQENTYGRIIFVVENPSPGWWRAVIRHAKGSSFVVRATAITQDAIEVVKKQWPKWRCTGCREGLAGLVEVAAVYIAGMVLGTAFATFKALSVAELARRFHLTERVIDYMLKRVTNVSVDALIEEVCMHMELCPAVPAKG